MRLLQIEHTKINYIKALRNNASILNYKTINAILKLLTYYSNGSFDDKEVDIDTLDNNPKADALFNVLKKYTSLKKDHVTFFDVETVIMFDRFDIPKKVSDTIIRKYIEEVKAFRLGKKVIKQQARQREQDEINEINNILNTTL